MGDGCHTDEYLDSHFIRYAHTFFFTPESLPAACRHRGLHKVHRGIFATLMHFIRYAHGFLSTDDTDYTDGTDSNSLRSLFFH